MATLKWQAAVGKPQCSMLYNRERLGLPPVQCGNRASPGKDRCKAHKRLSPQAR